MLSEDDRKIVRLGAKAIDTYLGVMKNLTSAGWEEIGELQSDIVVWRELETLSARLKRAARGCRPTRA